MFFSGSNKLVFEVQTESHILVNKIRYCYNGAIFSPFDVFVNLEILSLKMINFESRAPSCQILRTTFTDQTAKNDSIPIPKTLPSSINRKKKSLASAAQTHRSFSQ